MTLTAEITTDPRIAVAKAAVAALPAAVQALAVIDTSALPDHDFPVVVTVGDWYARVCHADHDGRGGEGFVAYLGNDFFTAPTPAYAYTAEELIPTVTDWINEPGSTYTEVAAIEGDLMSLARRLRTILRDGGDAEEITDEVRTLDPTAEALPRRRKGGSHQHLVTVRGRQLHLSYYALDRGWVWRSVEEADAA